MLKPRVFHHFKAGVVMSAALLVAVATGGLVWLNERGFEGQWSERIEEELTRRGIHADFASARFSPTRGIIAKDVVFYSDSERSPRNVFARIPRLRFDIDRGKALRGELQIRRLIIRDAEFTLPLNSTAGLPVRITNLSGRANLDRENRLVLKDAHGSVKGMDFELNLELDEFDFRELPGDSTEEEEGKDGTFSEKLVSELARWSFPGSQPPKLALRVTGSAKRPSTIRTSFSIAAAELTRRDYTMRKFFLAGELHGRTLTVDELAFSDGAGKLALHADYDLEDETGSYEVSSSIKIGDLLRKGLNDDTLNEFASARAPELDARGHFAITPEGLELSTIGKVEMHFFRFLGIPIDHLQTEFSWQNGDIFLRDLLVEHAGGELRGKILMQGDTIRYQATSSLPLSAFRAFLREDGGIARSLAVSVFTPSSRVHAEAEGSIRRSNLREWDARGTARLENFSYNGVPLGLVSAQFDITPLDFLFSEVEVEFLYDSYPPHQKHGGPRTGRLAAEKVHYDSETRLTHLEKVRGAAWPAPILRLFTPRAADHIDQSYRFRNPPILDSSGVIDMLKPPTRTDVTTLVQAAGLTDYDFAGQTLQMDGLSASVRTRPYLHDISDLKFDTLGGSAGGAITVRELPERAVTLQGALSWKDVDFLEVGKKYKFASPTKGSINARFTFGAASRIEPDGRRSWKVEGKTNLGESTFNGVPLVRAQADFGIDGTGSTWTNIEAEFDYARYSLRRRYGGPSSGIVRLQKLRHDRAAKLTSITDLRGTAWPGPVLRLFSPKSADHVDKSYGFRKPPEFVSAGVVDHRKPATRTDLTSRFRTRGTTDYEFLDRVLQITSASATIRTRPQRTEVSALKFTTMQGTGGGEVTVIERPGRPASIAGGIKWTDLSLGEIGRKYDFDEDAKGTITGRIDFTTEAKNVRVLNGKGVVGLRNGQLFHVPVFGPLSLPLSGILGKKFSHEQARDASATFIIKNGVVHTNNFLTSTPSTVFTGEGRVDLPTKHLDMTVRMNARGLLGLVILPLKPFNGLFQFRGQGPIKKPIWSPAPFTQPARGPDDPIFREPARAQIVPEP